MHDDLWHSGARADPYPVLARLREQRPVHREADGVWTVSRHHDVSALLRDRRLGRAPARWHAFDRITAGWVADDELATALGRWLLFLDPPAHTRIRTALSPAFTNRSATRHRAMVEAVADELLEPLAARGSFDLLSFAKPYPLRVLCRLLGIEGRDRRRVQRGLATVTATLARRLDLTTFDQTDGGTWTDALTRADPGGTASDLGLTTQVRDLVDARRRGDGPEAPLLDDLLASGLGDDDLVAAVVVTLVAGHETVANSVANAVLALLRDPDAGARLRSEPELLPTAAEELVRYDGPANLDYRVVLEPVELRGHRLEGGDLVFLSLAAANRDPGAFTEPDRLVLDRSPNPHLGYGAGIHRCLGIWLARLEVQVALERIGTRWPHLAVVEPQVIWRDVVNLRALRRLPVTT
jgi:hypothetical protein